MHTTAISMLGVLMAIFRITTPWQSERKRDDLLDALNGVQGLMGEAEYDGELYERLVGCFDKLDPKLRQSVTAQWNGFGHYATTGGNPDADPWKPCEAEGTKEWREDNCTVQASGKIPIWEPCNYASNLAYYRTVLEICEQGRHWSMPAKSVTSIGKAFASLGLGSAFFHGSQTIVGEIADKTINDLIAYVVFQEAFKPLISLTNSSMIHELSLTPRAEPAAKVVDDLMKAYVEIPVDRWGDTLQATDMPNLRLAMCGFFSTVLTYSFEDSVADGIITALLKSFTNIGSDVKEICVGKFLPEIRELTASQRPLSGAQRRRLVGNGFGVALKLLYAFVWQEQELAISPYIFLPFVNRLGAKFLPTINHLSSLVTDYCYSDFSFQSGENFYPDQDWCNKWYAHPKWHLETSIGLVDFIFLADDLHHLFADFVEQHDEGVSENNVNP